MKEPYLKEENLIDAPKTYIVRTTNPCYIVRIYHFLSLGSKNCFGFLSIKDQCDVIASN